jgi:hypothetical protein
MTRALVLTIIVLAWAACAGTPSGPGAADAPLGSPDGGAGPVDAPQSRADARAPDARAVGPDAALRDAPVKPPDARPGTPDARPGTPDAGPGAPDAPTSPCGDCPDGYTCGTANGLPVCRSDATGIPLFTHVTVIVMENLSLSELDESDNVMVSPFLQSLKTSAAYSTNYHGVTHPSLPNYLAMTSGDDFGVGCDCTPQGDGDCGTFSCTILTHSCSCPQSTDHLGDQLEAAGRSWRAYGESMGRDTPCRMDTDSLYAARHVPFVYYDDLQIDAGRCAQHVVDFSYLADETVVPDYVFIAPNLTNDMHDPVLGGHGPNIMHGDTWLSQTGVPGVTGRSAYKNGGLLVIVWDEDDYSGVFSDDDPIPMFVLSPYAKTGYTSSVHADHYSLLATIEDGLNLPRLANAVLADPLSDFFPPE